MKIYTSYYGKIKNDNRGLVPVRVSKSSPEWFSYNVEELSEVYPSWDIIMGIKNGNITQEEYERVYSQQLNKLIRLNVLQRLFEISQEYNNADIVLLCWEKSTDFCHRHILARWLDYDVEELE